MKNVKTCQCKFTPVPKNQIVSSGQDIKGPSSYQNIVELKSYNLSREMILTCPSFTKSLVNGENVADMSCQFLEIKIKKTGK